jgi:phenylacetic acid degradation operon negative regulatory protein
MRFTPRSLVLNLMLGAEARAWPTLNVRELLAAGALFGIAGNTMRVTLARAVAAGLLQTPRRGCYALGPEARPLAREVQRWRQAGTLTTPWTGEWIAVHVGAVGRSDRAAVRARERAFGLLGFAELERGLHLRPNNLVGGIDAVRARLRALLPHDAGVGTLFVLRGLTPEDDARARRLWDGAALDAAYRETTARLGAWLEDAHTLRLNEAARQCFDMGHDAIRQLTFDPMLPAPLVDTEARARFIEAVARYDDVGQAIWACFLARARAQDRLDVALPIRFPDLAQEITP